MDGLLAGWMDGRTYGRVDDCACVCVCGGGGGGGRCLGVNFMHIAILRKLGNSSV